MELKIFIVDLEYIWSFILGSHNGFSGAEPSPSLPWAWHFWACAQFCSHKPRGSYVGLIKNLELVFTGLNDGPDP